ncbi:LysR family transcriptional regulator [Morganella morganii]
MPRHFDDLMLGTLELFCRAAELQSFSQAAQVLNISPAAVSKTIARLEQKLGSCQNHPPCAADRSGRTIPQLLQDSTGCDV